MKNLFIALISLILMVVSTSAYAVVSITTTDGENEGFNDTTPTTPIGGNPGTTIGEQRLNVFNRAAELLSAQFDISVPMIINANFNPLTCDQFEAILGQAGPLSAQIDEASRSIIPMPLYNQLIGYDYKLGQADIQATFNSSIDNNDNCLADTNWYYGFDAPSNDDYSLLSVFIHELVHGMGFITFMRENGLTNFKFEDGNDALSIFTHNLKSVEDDELLSNLPWYSRGQAFLSETGLVWAGEKVNSLASGYDEGLTNGQVQMYAPAEQSDSSLSHFSDNLSPDEVMEPFYTGFFDGFGLATQALGDIGWTILNENTAPTLNSPKEILLNEDESASIALSASDSDGDVVTFNIPNPPEALGLNINNNILTVNPALNFNGAEAVVINITDGKAKIKETIDIIILAVNDTPVIDPVSNAEFNIDTTPEIDLVITDVDDTELQITAGSSFPSVVSVSLENNTLTLNSPSIYNGSSTITVTAFDGEDTASISFVATVTGGVVAPPLGLTFNESFVENNSVITALDHEHVSFAITGGDTVYNAEVEFNGENRPDLLTNDAGNLTLALPNSGAFAGSYELTIDDGNNTTNPITITIDRPLRIKTDTSLVLANTNTASIVFEGASPGDTISLSASEIGFSDSTGSTISTLIATDDADSFNQASAYIDASAAGMFDVIASLANTPDAQKSITVVSDRSLKLSVNDKASSQIVNAVVSIEDERISAWGLSQRYQVNAQGELSLTLPETELELRVSAESYNTKVISSNAQETSRSITLVLADGFYQLNGSVIASDFEFGSESPEITLNLSNGNTTTPDSSELDSSGVLTFRWLTELSAASPTSITFTHSAADDLTITLDSSLGSESIDAELIKTVVEEAPDNGDSGTDTGTDNGSGSSGGGNAAWLLITAIALLRRKRLKVKRA
jgi:hypothetical protein